eukprot:TRINITY_DN7124_c0_g1_i6.p1 TRINITY_DN7124_c0_g1~~TRINITY_DN7124_c0_g1_i6.p1  ORF type:complete len:323 (-),score=76.39 TRINITY_DN7124_c0_g1_i6:460-1428(-)
MCIRDRNADTRFNSLKIFSDLIAQIISEDSLYGDMSIPQAKMINEMIVKQYFGNLKTIITDTDPIPSYGLRLLSLLIERNEDFIAKLKKVKIANVILDAFTLNNQKLLTNTIKLVSRFVESSELSYEEMIAFNVMNKSAAILKHYWSANQEWCLDDLLDIIFGVLLKLLECLKMNKVAIISPENTLVPSTIIMDPNTLSLVAAIEGVFDIYDILFAILNQDDNVLADKAANILIYLNYIFGGHKRKDNLLKGENVLVVLSVLSSPSKIPRFRKALKILYWASSLQGQLKIHHRLLIKQSPLKTPNRNSQRTSERISAIRWRN